jgi:hypothetical protein
VNNIPRSFQTLGTKKLFQVSMSCNTSQLATDFTIPQQDSFRQNVIRRRGPRFLRIFRSGLPMPIPTAVFSGCMALLDPGNPASHSRSARGWMQTVASGGASFFFKGGHPSRRAGSKLFPTIACQLALCHLELRKAISQIVEDNPSIPDRALSVQLRKLINDLC